MSKKKITIPSYRKQDWKTVKAENEKNFNTYLNELHHEIKRTNHRLISLLNTEAK